VEKSTSQDPTAKQNSINEVNGGDGDDSIEMDLPTENPESESIKSKSILDRDDDDNDVILGSFFERNQHNTNENSQYGPSSESMMDHNENNNVNINLDLSSKLNSSGKNDDSWLLTPLPCLTSITQSQRSIVDNGPLENLLIEHPSMSVFKSAQLSINVPASIDEKEVSKSEAKTALPFKQLNSAINRSEKQKSAKMVIK
jgi:hypothetical protein